MRVIDDYFYVKDVGYNYWTKGGEKQRGNSIGDRIFYVGKKNQEKDYSYIKGSSFTKYSDFIISNHMKFNYKDFLNENDTFRFSKDILEISPSGVLLLHSFG